MMNPSAEIAAVAARLVVDEGMEYAAAKRRAARDFGPRVALPGNEEVEDAVREHIALFHADTQPAELRALRELALVWMARLAEFRPHLSGAAWRGTATRLSALHLDLYCDDSKAPEIALVNAGVDYDGAGLDRPGRREPLPLLTLAAPCPALGETVTLHLLLHDADEQRGALKPDARGRSWRGDAAALRRVIAQDDTEDGAAGGAHQD
ncbi:MAG: hypothetical protein KGN16_15365 [Burkholderiales bacterium]|nr:hypothetical protein [Burkholderiales bacterium]